MEKVTLFRLTKKDNESYICFAEGTDMCPIHNGSGSCHDCKVMKAIISKLAVYEEVIDEDGGTEHV